jgi:hypothetical protein
LSEQAAVNRLAVSISLELERCPMPAIFSSAHETLPAIHRLQYDSCQMDGLTAREAAGVAAVCSAGVYLLRNRVAL